MKPIYASLLAFAFALPASLLHADDNPDTVAASLSPYLVEARVFGEWSKDDAHGDIRYVMLRGGVEEVETKLYIQWVTADSEEDSKKVVASVLIEPVLGVFDPPKLLSTHPYVLHMEIGSIYCKETQLYDIEITGVGQYKLKSLNKKPCDPAESDKD